MPIIERRCFWAAAAYGRHDRDDRFASNGGRESANEPNVFFSDKNVDVRTNLALLGHYAVAYSGIARTERR